MFRIVMSSIMRRRRGLNSAIGGSCLRDGLQHPHPLSQEPLNKSPQSRRASGFVPSQKSHPSQNSSTRPSCSHPRILPPTYWRQSERGAQHDKGRTRRPARTQGKKRLDEGWPGQLSALRTYFLVDAFSRYLTASPTVTMVSAWSSGISTPNSSSNAITNSTVSSEAAPRSAMKLAVW